MERFIRERVAAFGMFPRQGSSEIQFKLALLDLKRLPTIVLTDVN